MKKIPADELYIDELLGPWNVMYPGADGVLVESYVEALELKIDGTFSWTPAPPWDQEGTGGSRSWAPNG